MHNNSCMDVSKCNGNSLFIWIRPGQSQPVPVHVMVILHHVFCGFIRGYEHDFELCRWFGLLHQLRVEITQQRREVSAGWTPSGWEIQANHFIPESFLWIDQISLFIHECSAWKHLDHRWRSQVRVQLTCAQEFSIHPDKCLNYC